MIFFSCKKCVVTFKHRWQGNCFWSFGTGRSAGVAVLFSPNFTGKILFHFHSDGHIFSMLIQIGLAQCS